MKNDPKTIIIHATDVSYATLYNQLSSVNKYHKNVRQFNRSTLGYYVGYHKLITGGKLYKTRDDFEHGNHCNTKVDGQSMNFKSLGIAVGFDGDIEHMTQNDYLLLQEEVKAWQKLHSIPNSKVEFHRAYNKGKTCPGRLLDSAWLKKLLTEAKPDDQKEKQIAIIKQQLGLYTLLLKALVSLRDLLMRK